MYDHRVGVANWARLRGDPTSAALFDTEVKTAVKESPYSTLPPHQGFFQQLSSTLPLGGTLPGELLGSPRLPGGHALGDLGGGFAVTAHHLIDDSVAADLG